MANRISLLMAHLGGKAYSLRSAIVTAIGTLVQKAFENAPGEDADAQGAPLLCIMSLLHRQTVMTAREEYCRPPCCCSLRRAWLPGQARFCLRPELRMAFEM